MDRNGTSRKHDKYWDGKPLKLRPGAHVHPYDPTVRLRNPEFIRSAILQALNEGDFEGVVEIYRAHLRVLNRTRTAKVLKVSRQAVHKMLKSNVPSLRTFTTFMKALENEIEAASPKK